MSQYMALYRKWRPAVFSDVVGQDHITRVLKSEIMQGSVSHAYLFCGSRGTGKTTCAKILAKAVSCENPVDGDPCGECEKCRAFENSFDIVEMDAASNNGVDDVRELKEKINFLPIEMKRRVYIIDEVHMLSVSAFNALLKTLEEPPEHVMFILATTELNKIPATILSRCKRFDFHRIGTEDIAGRLKFVCEKENIGIDKDALRLIATLATGAMRDALSMLELFVGKSSVTRKEAEAILGVVGNETVIKLLYAVAGRDAKSALETVYESYNSSKDPGVLCSELGNMFRDLLVMKYASSSVTTLIDESEDVIAALRDVEEEFTPERLLYCTEVVENTVAKLARSELSRRTVLELMIMRLCDSRLVTSSEAILERISALESAPRTSSAAPSRPAAEYKPSAESAPSPVKEQQVRQNAVSVQNDDDVPPFDMDGLVPPPEEPVYNAPASPAPVQQSKPKAKPQGKASAFADKTPLLSFGEIMQAVKEKNPITASFLDNARAFLDGDVLTIAVNGAGVFMLQTSGVHKKTLEECASRILGYAVSIVIVPDTPDETNPEDDFPLG